MREVDFTTPGSSGPSTGTRDGVQAAAARLAVDLSPTTSLGISRLKGLDRVESSANLGAGRVWFPVATERGDGAILMDQGLAVAVADALMGGPGNPSERPLTGVEELVLRPHVQRVARTLGSVLCEGPVVLGAPVKGTMTLPGPLLVVDVIIDTPPVIVEQGPDTQDDPFATPDAFQIPAESAGPLGVISMAVPAPASATPDKPKVHDSELMPEGCFAEVPLPLSVRTRSIRASASRMRSIAVGDQLLLRHSLNEPFLGLLGGVPRLSMDISAMSGQIVAHVLRLDFETAADRIWPDDARVRAPYPQQSEPGGQAKDSTDHAAADEGTDLMADKEKNMSNYADSDFQQALAAADGALAAADGAGAAPGAATGLGHLADVPVEVAVEVGRTLVTLREALALAPSQVLTLDAEAGEPAVILVNGRAVARGQVLVVGDVYGVRISELLDPAS